MKQRIKKILSFLGWSAGIVTLLLLVFFIALKLVFPESKLKQMIAAQVETATGWQLSLDDISWSLAGRLEVENLALSAHEVETTRQLFYLKKAKISFRLQPLLQKRLEIAAISLDSPRINMSLKDLARFSKDSASSLPKDTTFSAQPAREAQPLPLGVDLHSLTLSHFDLKMDMSDSLVSQQIEVSDLNIEVENLTVPRGFPNTSAFISGSIKFFTGESRTLYQIDGEAFEIIPHLKVSFQSEQSGEWAFDPQIDIADASGNHAIRLSGKLHGVRLAESLRVSNLNFQLDDQKIFQIDGSAAMSAKDTTFQIDLLGDEVDLASALLTARAFIPSAYDSLFGAIRLSGRSEPLRGVIQGGPNRIAFELASEIGSFNISMFPADATNLQVRVGARGAWTKEGLSDGALSIFFKGDAVKVAINDSTDVTAHELFAESKMALDGQGIPIQGDFSAHVENLFSGAFNLDGKWSMPSAERWSEIKTSVILSLDKLALSDLPGQTGRLWGDFNAGAHIEANSVRDVRYQISGAGTGVAFLAGEVKEELPVTSFENSGALSFDPESNQLAIDSTQFHLLDIVTGRASGKIDLDEQSGSILVDRIYLNNEDIAKVVPKRLAPQFEWIRLHGQEVFTGKVAFKTEQGTFVPEFSGQVEMIHAGAELLEQDISLNGLESLIRFRGNMEKISGDVAVQLGSLSVPQFRPEPITGSTLYLDWNLFGPDSLSVENGNLGIPALFLSTDFNAQVVLSAPAPEFQSHLLAHFTCPQWMAINEMIACRGNSTIDLAVSTLQNGETIGIRGKIGMDSLSLRQEELFSVRNISAHIPIEAEFDPAQAALIPDRTWTTRYRPSYESTRFFYNSKDGTVENLKIDQIQVTDYTLDNIVMDVMVDHGILDVPYFSLDVLDGRVGGSLWFNPGTGNPDSLAYRFRAHMTRINSAALMVSSKQKDEETELNANLDFTGRGIDPKRGLDLDGFFHITQIGPGFASTLLKGLDPEGKDAGMKMTRRLMDFGYKPKVFSFELRHGYVYPSLSLSQPWYLPLRIPGRLEYTRLPVEFFLTNSIVQNQ